MPTEDNQTDGNAFEEETIPDVLTEDNQADGEAIEENTLREIVPNARLNEVIIFNAVFLNIE